MCVQSQIACILLISQRYSIGIIKSSTYRYTSPWRVSHVLWLDHSATASYVLRRPVELLKPANVGKLPCVPTKFAGEENNKLGNPGFLQVWSHTVVVDKHNVPLLFASEVVWGTQICFLLEMTRPIEEHWCEKSNLSIRYPWDIDIVLKKWYQHDTWSSSGAGRRSISWTPCRPPRWTQRARLRYCIPSWYLPIFPLEFSMLVKVEWPMGLTAKNTKLHWHRYDINTVLSRHDRTRKLKVLLHRCRRGPLEAWSR